MEQPLKEQAWARGLSGPKPGTSMGAGPSQGYLQERALASYLHWSMPKSTTSTGADQSQPSEQLLGLQSYPWEPQETSSNTK